MKITVFKGAAPAIDPINIADNAAQVAINCRMDSGSIEPWKTPLQVAIPTKAGTILSMYRFGQDVLSDSSYWFNWTENTSVARGPVADDATERTYFTEDGQPPRVTDASLAVGADLPSNWRVLGTPQPKGTLAASVANRGIASIVRSGTTATVTTTQDIEFPVGSKFTPVISGAAQSDYNGTFAAAVVTDIRTFTFTVPSTAVTPATGTISYIYDGTAETRIYTYSWTNDLNQEGPPWVGANESPLVVTVLPGQIVTLTGLESSPSFLDRAGSVIPGSKRLYRSNGGEYMLEATLSAAAGSFTSVSSSLTSETVLAAPYRMPPPANAKGIIAIPNEMMAMYRDKTWMVCERSYPHSWPTDYWMDCDYPIVGHAAFAGGVIVCTTAKTYLVQVGADPRSASMPAFDNTYGCVSQRSISGAKGGICFASHDGLAYATAGGVEILTGGLISREQWQALNPSSILGAFHDGRYFGFYDNGVTKGGFILRIDTGELTWTDVHATAAHVDQRSDALFLCVNHAIVKWNSGSSYMAMRWRSKKYIKPPASLAGALVAADGPVTFRHYCDGLLKLERSVANREPFNLKGGRHRFDEFEIVGSSRIVEVHASNNRRDLV
ncbi:MAG: hypothetical protein IPO08_23460 [Xanthomonadales bacterium]|nr:hypothetical protein [Xanthomonadales bacterium]